MSFDVAGNVFEQGAAAHQQKSIAPHHLEREGAEGDPPQEQAGHSQSAPEGHHANGNALRETEITEEALRQECDAHHQAELLEQPDPRVHVHPRIEIAEVHADQDGEQDRNEAHEAAVIEQVGLGIGVEGKVGCQDESGGRQQGVRNQQRERSGGNIYPKKARHPEGTERITISSTLYQPPPPPARVGVRYRTIPTAILR